MKKAILSLFMLLWFVLPSYDANRFGVCITPCTWDGSDTTMWSTTSGGGTGASVPGSSDAVIFDAATCVGGVTCTIIVNTTVTVQSITMGACTGLTSGCILDFNSNNNNVTLSVSLSYTGTGTRSLNIGSGTWTFTGTGTLINGTTLTNSSITLSSASLVFTATSASARSITHGATFTVGSITVNANTSGGIFNISNSGSAITIGTLSLVAPNSATFPTGVTTTVTNAMTLTGSSTNQIGLLPATPGSTATISSANNGAFTWTGIRDLAFTGGGTFSATDSFNLGRNSGITITPPASGGGGPNIIGGYLLDPANDNTPLFLNKAA